MFKSVLPGASTELVPWPFVHIKTSFFQNGIGKKKFRSFFKCSGGDQFLSKKTHKNTNKTIYTVI